MASMSRLILGGQAATDHQGGVTPGEAPINVKPFGKFGVKTADKTMMSHS